MILIEGQGGLKLRHSERRYIFWTESGVGFVDSRIDPCSMS